MLIGQMDKDKQELCNRLSKFKSQGRTILDGIGSKLVGAQGFLKFLPLIDELFQKETKTKDMVDTPKMSITNLLSKPAVKQIADSTVDTTRGEATLWLRKYSKIKHEFEGLDSFALDALLQDAYLSRLVYEIDEIYEDMVFKFGEE